MKLICLLCSLIVSLQVHADDWLNYLEPQTSEWRSFDSGEALSFSGQRLNFRYLIERNNASERKQGALLIKIQKRYGVGKPIWRTGLRNIYWQRTEFPNQPEIPEHSSLRDIYDNFHATGSGDIDLRNKFHAEIPPEWDSLNPRNKLRSFRFEEGFDDRSIQKALLLHYETIGKNGSWFPFEIIAQEEFDEIRITIIELDPPFGLGFMGRSISILNSR